MGLQEINREALKRERSIMQNLLKCIDERKSLVFDAGAGSGKTYALVESLQYVIQKYGEQLNQHNQKIMCITYTNVAANNIKRRIGNTNLVVISTIHERLWQLIKGYQKELLVLHKEKMENEIKQDIMELTNNKGKNEKVFKVYRELSNEDKEEFAKIVELYKKEFYQGYTMNADNFRKHYNKYVEKYPNIMKNVEYFRTIVTKLYKLRSFKECLLQIEKGNLRKIDYDAMYNDDRLDRMRISHDTLLEYGKKLILKYPILQQIIFDQFPFIFIDEYQDTSEVVVEIMATIDKYAKEMNHDFFIGYYGDRVQNIYDKGIGCHLLEKHMGLEKFSKEFNRRSYKEIIDVANKIRLDELQQKSIYVDCYGGSVEFCNEISVEEVIKKWKDTTKETIHCLILKNEEIAKKIRISNLYNVFKRSLAYSGSRVHQLNTELLSIDTQKLGVAASFLYRIFRFYADIRWEGTPVQRILYGDIKKYYRLDINKLREIKKKLQEIKGETLNAFLLEMCKVYKTGDENIRRIIEAILDLDEITYNHAVGFLMQTLEGVSTQDEENKEDTIKENESLEKVKQLLAISMEEFERWFNYIEQKERTEVVYHTFHGTKGLEFENVLIVLEDGLGIKSEDKVFLKNFLEEYPFLRKQQQVMGHEKARNLLYVAVTRTIKHLKVIYTGNFPKVKETLHYIFNSEKDKSIECLDNKEDMSI